MLEHPVLLGRPIIGRHVSLLATHTDPRGGGGWGGGGGGWGHMPLTLDSALFNRYKYLVEHNQMWCKRIASMVQYIIIM